MNRRERSINGFTSSLTGKINFQETKSEIERDMVKRGYTIQRRGNGILVGDSKEEAQIMYITFDADNKIKVVDFMETPIKSLEIGDKEVGVEDILDRSKYKIKEVGMCELRNKEVCLNSEHNCKNCSDMQRSMCRYAGYIKKEIQVENTLVTVLMYDESMMFCIETK